MTLMVPLHCEFYKTNQYEQLRPLNEIIFHALNMLVFLHSVFVEKKTVRTDVGCLQKRITLTTGQCKRGLI